MLDYHTRMSGIDTLPPSGETERMPDQPHGIVSAIVTPFNEDESIDYRAWQPIIDALIGAGVDGIFFAGGQGEFYCLSEEERKAVCAFGVKAIAGRVPVYANVGAVTTGETVRLARAAEAVGVDYAVVITPYYLRPTPDELVEHYAEVCRSVRIPVLAYNMPARTGVELTPSVLRRVCTMRSNLIGLKDTSGKIDQLPEWNAAGMAVFMGRDDLITRALDLGAVGAVTACSNVAPRLFTELYRAWRARNREEAARLQSLAAELRLALGQATFRSFVKEAMNMSGMPAGRCRRPAGFMPPPECATLAAVLEKLRAQNYTIGHGAAPAQP